MLSITRMRRYVPLSSHPRMHRHKALGHAPVPPTPRHDRTRARSDSTGTAMSSSIHPISANTSDALKARCVPSRHAQASHGLTNREALIPQRRHTNLAALGVHSAGGLDGMWSIPPHGVDYCRMQYNNPGPPRLDVQCAHAGLTFHIVQPLVAAWMTAWCRM